MTRRRLVIAAAAAAVLLVVMTATFAEIPAISGTHSSAKRLGMPIPTGGMWGDAPDRAIVQDLAALGANRFAARDLPGVATPAGLATAADVRGPARSRDAQPPGPADAGVGNPQLSPQLGGDDRHRDERTGTPGIPTGAVDHHLPRFNQLAPPSAGAPPPPNARG